MNFPQSYSDHKRYFELHLLWTFRSLSSITRYFELHLLWTSHSLSPIRRYFELRLLWRNRGRFKNTYKLVNLGARKLSLINLLHIFSCMDKMFCGTFEIPHKKSYNTLKEAIFFSIEDSFVTKWNIIMIHIYSPIESKVRANLIRCNRDTII